MTLNRREFMARTGALAGAAALPGTALAADTIKLGSILDTSGIFDAYGTPMDMAMRLAVQEINASGGLNGKEVEVLSYDTQSDMALYSQYAQQLVRQDKVDVVHGGILSASREAIRQTLRKANTLYFYNVLYEGGVCDRNIFIDGVTPAQQVEALIPFAMSRTGKRIHILAADYNYGQITAKWIRKYVADNGGESAAVDFFPLDVSDFGSTIAKIQTVGPDLVVASLVGGAHLSFFRQWAAAGNEGQDPARLDDAGSGERTQGAHPRGRQRNHGRLQLQSGAGHAREPRVQGAVGASLRRHLFHPRDRGLELPGRDAVGRSGAPGGQHEPR